MTPAGTSILVGIAASPSEQPRPSSTVAAAAMAAWTSGSACSTYPRTSPIRRPLTGAAKPAT